MSKTSRFAVVTTLLLVAGAARAQPSGYITYSGFLTDGAGTPVTAVTTLTFRFYSGLTGGTAIGNEIVGVVPNSEGYFSVLLGAGYTVTVAGNPSWDQLFTSQVFMSIQVQGDSQEMSPRVTLSSVPSAITVAWGGVTGFPAPCGPGTMLTGFDSNTGGALCVADADSGGTIRGVTAGTGLTGGGTSGTVTLNVDATAVQTRVSGTCTGGQYMTGVNQAGTVACSTPAAGTGTVTNVATGAGLTGGPITTTGTVSIATGGVTSAMIADGTVDFVDWAASGCLANQIPKRNSTNTAWICSADVDTNSGGTITGVTAGTGLTGGGTTGAVTLAVSPTAVQTRVGGSCAAGSSIRVINQDGTVTCQTDTNSGGTVTSVTATAGGGILMGGTATAPTVGLNSAAAPTFAGLTVTGDLSLGWEIVQASGGANVYTWTGCANFGGGTCYSGPVTATCSAGKRVIGGGCMGGNVFRSTLSDSRPTAGGDGWICHASTDTTTTTITTYAICARLAP